MDDHAIVVLASRWDSGARSLVDRWADHDAHLLTPAGLSVSGWRYRVGEAGQSALPLDGHLVRGSQIRGVVCRLAHVSEQDLPHIVEEHREYVAAEMHAFLLSWLTELACPVVNRPSATTLNGPPWRLEQWVWTAAAEGIRIRPTYRRHALGPSLPARDGEASVQVPSSVRLGAGPNGQGAVAGAEPRVIEVVGQTVLGDQLGNLAAPARRLAAAAGVEALTAVFDVSGPHPLLIWASAWVDVGKEDVADALLALVGPNPARRPRMAGAR